MDFKIGLDQLGVLFIAFTFQLAGNAAGQEVFEIWAKFFGKPAVAFAPGTAR